MEWKEQHHILWLGACLFGLLFATLVTGFSALMAIVVVIVALTGTTLISIGE